MLSANRPYELLGTGANQTMEQLGYFGTQVRATISLGLAEDARRGWTRSTRSGARRRAEFWWPPRGSRTRQRRPGAVRHPAARAAGARPRGPRRVPRRRPARRQAVDLHAAGHVRPAAGHRPDPRHRRHRRARRRACTPTSPRCRPSPSRPRPPPANPLHPLALPLLRPQQVIMLGRPTLHRPVSALLADPSVPVFALTTGPALARRVGQLAGHRHPRGDHRRARTRPGCVAAPRCTGTPSDAVRGQLAAHPLTTGLHVAAAVADALRPGDQLVLGASNPVRDAALVGLNTPRHHGAVQPRRRRHRRHGVDGDRRGAGARRTGGPHRRADRRPDVRARQLRPADRAHRADAAAT